LGSNVKFDLKELFCLLGKKLLLEVVNHTRGTTISPRSKLQATPFQIGRHIKEVQKLHKRGSLKKHLAKLWARLV
jgi:hypothetical protein